MAWESHRVRISPHSLHVPVFWLIVLSDLACAPRFIGGSSWQYISAVSLEMLPAMAEHPPFSGVRFVCAPFRIPS